MEPNDSTHMSQQEHEDDERERHREEIREIIEEQKPILDRLADD